VSVSKSSQFEKAAIPSTSSSAARTPSIEEVRGDDPDLATCRLQLARRQMRGGAPDTFTFRLVRRDLRAVFALAVRRACDVVDRPHFSAQGDDIGGVADDLERRRLIELVRDRREASSPVCPHERSSVV